MEDRDIVLFLGAGFSHFAGLPTMAEFGDESEKELYKLENDEINQKKKQNQCSVKLVKHFKHFRNSAKMPKVLLKLIQKIWRISIV